MRQSHHFRFLFVYANLPNCGLVHMIRPELIVSRCYCTQLSMAITCREKGSTRLLPVRLHAAASHRKRCRKHETRPFGQITQQHHWDSDAQRLPVIFLLPTTAPTRSGTRIRSSNATNNAGNACIAGPSLRHIGRQYPNSAFQAHAVRALLRSKVQIVQYRLASDASYVLADSEAPLSAVTAASWQPRRELVLGRMFISSTTAVREFRPGKRDSRVCAPTQDHSQILLGCLSST